MLKLKSSSKPHLYIDQIKKMMEGDTYLHPQMKAMLLTLKKSRLPYLTLATQKEIILYDEKHLHFERAIQPSLTPFFKVDWSEQEIKEFEQNKEAYLDNVLKLYKTLGYEISLKENYGIEDCEKLIKSIGGKNKK